MSVSKILLATDFSTQADIAVQHAMAIARHTDAEIIMVHALGLSFLDNAEPAPIQFTGTYRAHIDAMEVQARENLGKLREHLSGQGVEISHIIVDSTPEKGILSVADDSNADLIVTGSHGRNSISAFFLGSVSRHIAQKAQCDVLIARGTPTFGGYKKILVPTDFSIHSERAVTRAWQLATPNGQVDLLNCWRLPGGPVTYWGDVGPGFRDSLRQTAIDHGNSCMARIAPSEIHFQFFEAEGDPRGLIAERAENDEYDLVVMGSHGRSGLNRLLLGSVAESVIPRIDTPVYLARNGPQWML